MELTLNARNELKTILLKVYGDSFLDDLNDEDVDQIGNLLLEIMVEGLKLRIRKS